MQFSFIFSFNKNVLSTSYTLSPREWTGRGEWARRGSLLGMKGMAWDLSICQRGGAMGGVFDGMSVRASDF